MDNAVHHHPQDGEREGCRGRACPQPAPGGERQEAHQAALDWLEGARIVLVALAAAAVWLHLWEPIAAFSVIGTAGLVIGGWPILKEAFGAIAARRMTMELSIAIAICAAAAIGEFFTALVITLFVLVAEVLEEMTVGRGRKAIRDLTVISGHSFVDESRITGESLPVEKLSGVRVFAGSIDQSGALEVATERIGRDTSYGKIIEAVERAEKSRAPVQRLANRLAGYLVYFALGAAALTFLITRDIYSTISVIIVAGACGIAAGTPLAILGGIGRSARLGAIIKGGVHLETLGRVGVVVLDKTGTLTYGRPEVQQLMPGAGTTAGELLDAATTAEMRSEHPLGKALLAYARHQGRAVAEPSTFSYTPGRGIEARIAESIILVGNDAWMTEHGVALPSVLEGGSGAGTEIFVSRDGLFLGRIVMGDTVRPEARQALAALHAMGIRTVLLTGDTRRVAMAVGNSLGIDDIEAGLLPEDKLKRIEALTAQGHVMAMVGDGVNDAPALVQANVGVAMGSGTDVAQESADIVLLGNDLGRFAETLSVARRTRGIIWQNFAGTLTVNTLGVLLAAFGFLNPLLAAFIHVSSEFVFILNSARLLPPRVNGGEHAR
ncbi:MAG: cation-translocating P-type ATPase [Candidimonas sp.]|nr:MAG: cation-translocating P-type ATPase [Candidimonas sp.]